MSRSRISFPLLAVVLSGLPTLAAQMPQGVARGDLIRVRSSASAPWLTGVALEVRNDSLFLEQRNRAGMVGVGQNQIVGLQRGTSYTATGKGALIGLGVGAALGAGMGLAVGNDDFIGCNVGCIALMTGVVGAVGAGAGALLGTMAHSTRWMDLGSVATRVAVTPIVTGRRVGAMVTLRWGKRDR